MNGMRIWTLAAVVVIAAVLALGWLIGVSPLLNQAAASDEERTTVELTNAAQEATLAQMMAQDDQIDELLDDLEVLQASISSTVDSDAIYALLADYQAASGAVPDLISLGEAIQYGVPVVDPGTTTAEDAPASGGAPSGALATSLYQVPVSISFSGTPMDKVLSFVAALQRGSRLFLVTSVSVTPEGGTTLGAYLFVIYDGTTATIVQPPDETTTPDATPAPTDGATPGATDPATPAPTPTETTGP